MNIPTDIHRILGLSTTEEKVLSSITKMGKSISSISRDTKVPRTSLLYILEKLKKRSLVRMIRHGNRAYWKSDIDTALRHLFLQNNISLPEITEYRGRAELFGILEKIIELPKNARVSGIQPKNSLRQALQKIELPDLLRLNMAIRNQALIVEGIVHEESIRMILSDFKKEKAKQIIDSFVGRLEDYVKIPEEFANVESEVYIFKNSAYLINWNKEIAVGIHDNDMVALLAAMFSCVKDFGTRYNQTEKMKIYSPK